MNSGADTRRQAPHSDSSQPVRGERVWGFRSILVLFFAYLLVRALQARNLPFGPLDWAFQSSDEVIGWLRGLVRRELVGFGMYFLLGLLTPPAWGPAVMSGNRSGRWLAWGLFGLVTIALCFAIAWSVMPPVGTLLLPFASYLVGARLSSSAQLGARSFTWAVGQISVLLILLLVMASAALRLAVSAAPLELAAGTFSDSARQLLAQHIRETRPRDDQPLQLQLTDADINALAASALGRGAVRHWGNLEFSPGTFGAQASLALPREVSGGNFLNVRLTGRLAIDDGNLELDLQELTVGSLAVPSIGLRLLSSGIYTTLLNDPQIRNITQAIVALNLRPGTADVVFRPGALGTQVVPSLAQLLWSRPDVAFETGIYLRHLIGISASLPPEADRFGLLMQGAFALAVERSAEHDPLIENRAALFALAILLGHSDLEPFVGELLDPDLRLQARQMIGTVTLRGRQDWARHFLVSAALVLLSNESASDRIGLLKEQLDAQDGGSGFSFADKLANFAGNRLAMAAIGDETSARRLQERLALGFEVDAFFPPADGLTEDIPAADFQRRYGGLGGAGYREVMDEINRRLNALPPI